MPGRAAQGFGSKVGTRACWLTDAEGVLALALTRYVYTHEERPYRSALGTGLPRTDEAVMSPV